jgi:hypothetical protein
VPDLRVAAPAAAVVATCLAALAAGCGEPAVVCDAPTTVLVAAPGDALTCADVDVAVDYHALLASRPVVGEDRRVVREAWEARFRSDPVGARAALTAVAASHADLTARTGFDATEARATAVWAVLHGDSPLGAADDALPRSLARSVAAWSSDADSRLVLSEMDVEGWLRYASLCRELQGGGALRLSVADRVTVYRAVVERFDAADRPTQLAMLAIGPVWPSALDAWAAAPYETQQRFATSAPLPPPMTASSLGYVEALVATDVTGHALALHDVLGPLRLGVARP